MNPQTEPDIDRHAIAEAAQRVVERAALQKVRKAIDSAQDAQARERRTLRRALLVSGVLVALAVAVLLTLVLSSQNREKGPLPIPTAQKK